MGLGAVGDRGVPDGGEHDQLGVGGVVVAARLEPGDLVAPALAELVDDLRGTFPLARPDASPGGPTAASRVAIPRPAGPVPPNTPMCMPRASHSPTPIPHTP